MRGFDLTDNWGVTPVTSMPTQDVPVVDTTETNKDIES